MSIIWRKVWRDLWRSKFRTAMVVISTAVGVFALGFVYGASGVMSTQLTESHLRTAPAHITFGTSLFDQEVIDIIRHEPGIIDAEGQTVSSFRWKLEGETEWHDALVVARPNYVVQQIDRFELLDGVWPSDDALMVERMSARHYGIPVGSTILVEWGSRERRVTIQGIARHAQAPPPQLIDTAFFFATPEMLSYLANIPQGFNRLYLRMESFDEQAANEVAERIQDRLERMDVGVGGYAVTDPEVHQAQESADSILLILQVLGILSLGLSGFMIANMTNATVAQQVWQIGVMKVVGATRGRVMRVYLSAALVYSTLALILAVLPAAVASHLLASLLLGLFNVAVGPLRLVPSAVGIQVTVGLAVPLLTALVPVIGAARITPHQAIGNYGLGAGFGRSWLDRLVGRIQRLPRPLALSMRNTFRRKARILLTLVTLVLGGVMFIVVMSVGASMTNTVEVLLGDFGFDVLLAFNRLYRVPRLVEVAESVDGVTRVEAWGYLAADLELSGGEEREAYLWGVPSDSMMFSPRIASGRGLLPGDGRAILLNNKIATDEGIQVGDEIVLEIEDRESTWTVVGLVINVNNLQRDSFVPYDTLARVTGNVNRGSMVMVMADAHDAATQQRLIDDLSEAYSARHMEPAGLQSAAEVRQLNQTQFDVITYLMLAMAILAAIVGSVGLASTMSINVTERAREIGVMRAVGARSAAILGIFVVEGIFVGILSWLLAVPLSYPGALALNNMVSTTLFQIPLDFDYSLGGMIGWLVIVIALSTLASLFPALRATQVSVRESLAYE